MASNFKEEAIECVRLAVREDNAGNYAVAFPLYMKALEAFNNHLKNEKNPKIKEAIMEKFTDYLRRAEEIRAVVNDNCAVATKARTYEDVKQAVQEDKAGNFAQAFPLYINALDYIKTHLESEKNPLIKEAIIDKFAHYLRRAEEIRAVLDDGAAVATKAITYEDVKKAVEEDNAGNYAKAFPLYVNALECLETHLKYETNPKIKDVITQKFTEYLRRAEEIRAILHDRSATPPIAAAVATNARTKNDAAHREYPEQAKFGSRLSSVINRERPNVRWNDIAGLESAKQALREAFIFPLKFPTFFKGKRRLWRAFLLYGPPGTGKSCLAKAVATEAESTFFSVSSSDLVSMWMGGSEKLVANIFQTARDNAPSIIFIDEIDYLCRQGEGNERGEASQKIKMELLLQMQGVGNTDEKILVLAATNTPYALDQSIRRCLDKRIYIPLPDLKARQYIFKGLLGDAPNNLMETDFEELARKTERFSGSDISVCVKNVLSEYVRRTQDAMHFKKVITKAGEEMWMPCGLGQPGGVATTMQDLATKGLAAKIPPPPPITKMDFDKVILRQKPTVTRVDLELYESFTKAFGEMG